MPEQPSLFDVFDLAPAEHAAPPVLAAPSPDQSARDRIRRRPRHHAVRRGRGRCRQDDGARRPHRRPRRRRRRRSAPSPRSRSPRRRPPSCATGSAHGSAAAAPTARHRRPRSTGSTTPRSARCTPSPAACSSSSRSRPGCRRASRCSTSSRASSRSTSGGTTSSTSCSTMPSREVAPDLRGCRARRSCCELDKFGVHRGLRQVDHDFQANWDLVDAARRPSMPPLRPTADPTALARPGSSDRRRSPSPPDDTPGASGSRIVGRARPSCGRCGDRRSAAVLAALDELAPTPGARCDRQQDELEGATAATTLLDALRGRAARCWPTRSTPTCSTWLRRTGAGVVGAICGRFVLERRRGARRRRHARVPRPARARPPAAWPPTPTSGAASTSATSGVLLDEFQDTDPIQLEIAVRLTADPDGPADRRRRLACVAAAGPAVRRRRPEAVDLPVPTGRHRPVPAGRRTRSAPTRAALSANFRSTDAVIDWVNDVFGQPSSSRARRPARLPAARRLPADAPRDHGSVHVLGVGRARRRRHVERRGAAAARGGRSWPPTRGHRAARRVAGAATGDGGLRPCRPGDIAVLLPARTSLPALEPALADAGASRTGPRTARSCTLAPEIRDAACSRCARPTTRPTSWRSSPRCARRCTAAATSSCSSGARAGGRCRIWHRRGARRRSPTIRSPRRSRHLRVDRRATSAVVTPADLLDRLVDERRVLDGALDGADARDVWRRVRFVVDQARAWTDAGGHGLRRYLALGRAARPPRAGPRHDPARARPRRRADHDGARRQGPRVPDHRSSPG